MEIREQHKNKLVILSQAFDSRSKILYLFYFIGFFCVGSYILKTVSSDASTPGWMIFFLLLGSAFYLAAYRYLNSALSSERILISDRYLQLINKGLLKNSVKSYPLNEISNLRYIEKRAISEHPLAGKSMDYLGFQTQELVTSEMYGENNIAFDFHQSTVHFGKGIYSWEFEEIKNHFNKSENGSAAG